MRGFRCASCGEWHDELPLDVGFNEPDYVNGLSARERAAQVSGDEGCDFRILRQHDGEPNYFIRGVIEISIHDSDELFMYGVWTSLSEASYKKATDAYARNESAGPLFGWLANALPGYPDTLSLKTNVFVRPDSKASIVLEPSDHPLSVEQRDGITRQRVTQIITPLLHPREPDSPTRTTGD